MDSLSIGRAIKKLRKEKKYTQQQLAQKLCVSDKAVSKWERGIGIPDVSLLAKLSIILDTDIESLLAGNIKHNARHWRGIIRLSNEFDLFHKKASGVKLLDCMIAQYLLVGISNIFIISDELDTLNEIIKKYNVRKNIHVECCKMTESDKILSFISDFSIMYIYNNPFIYGPDLTKYYQRAMSRDVNYVMPYVVSSGIKCDDESIIIFEDVTEESLVPILFWDNKLLEKSNINFLDIVKGEYRIDKLKINGEQMGRGMFWLNIKSESDVRDVLEYISIVQRTQGIKVYDINEIVDNRSLDK